MFTIKFWVLLVTFKAPRHAPSTVLQIVSSVSEASMKGVERMVRVAESSLRCSILGLAVLSATLVGTSSQVRTFFSLEKKAIFTDMKALVFLVVANALVAGYSLVQVMRCVWSVARGSVLFNKSLAWAIFSCDQVLAYLSIAAVSAAAESGFLGKFGQPEFQWMKICNLYEKFCNQVGEGIVISFLLSIAMVAISCISCFNLFRLYGGNKGRQLC